MKRNLLHVNMQLYLTIKAEILFTPFESTHKVFAQLGLRFLQNKANVLSQYLPLDFTLYEARWKYKNCKPHLHFY